MCMRWGIGESLGFVLFLGGRKKHGAARRSISISYLVAGWLVVRLERRGWNGGVHKGSKLIHVQHCAKSASVLSAPIIASIHIAELSWDEMRMGFVTNTSANLFLRRHTSAFPKFGCCTLDKWRQYQKRISQFTFSRPLTSKRVYSAKSCCGTAAQRPLSTHRLGGIQCSSVWLAQFLFCYVRRGHRP